MEHLVDGAERQRAHRMAEMLVHGGLREGALPARGTPTFSGSSWARQADMISRNSRTISSSRSGPCVAPALRSAPAQHLRLALRPVEIHRCAVGVLGDADLLRQPRALVDAARDRVSGRPSIRAADGGAERGRPRCRRARRAAWADCCKACGAMNLPAAGQVATRPLRVSRRADSTPSIARMLGQQVTRRPAPSASMSV
jgi:hypothetical protein